MLIKTTDIDIILNLEQKCFKYPYTLNMIDSLLKTNICFLIMQDNIIAGYIILLKIDSQYELIRIGILEEYRNREIAYNAMQGLLSDLNSKFFLEVNENNNAAINLYYSLGFKVINKRKRYYADGSDALIMLYDNE